MLLSSTLHVRYLVTLSCALFVFEAMCTSTLSATDDRYCIMPTSPEQHVISGLKRVVVPFTVVNYDKNFEQDLRVMVQPENARASVHAIDTKTSIDDGGIGLARFEVWVEGVTSEALDSTYIVTLQHAKSCNPTGITHTIVAHENILPYKQAVRLDDILNRRLFVGSKLSEDVHLPGQGNLPVKSFTVRSILNGRDTSYGSDYVARVVVDCIPNSLKSLNVTVTWQYSPLGSSYSESVVIYDNTTTNSRFRSAEIDISQRSEYYDGKSRKYVVNTIVVDPPKVDCGVKARSEDMTIAVEVSPATLGQFKLRSEIESQGNDTYRTALQLSPRLDVIRETLKTVKRNATLRSSEGHIDVQVSAGLRGKDNMGSEGFTVIFPEVRMNLEEYRNVSPIWSANVRRICDDYKGKLTIYALEGQEFETLKGKMSRTGTLPIEPRDAIDSVKAVSTDLYDHIRSSVRRSSKWSNIRERLLTEHEYDTADVDKIFVRRTAEYLAALRQYEMYTRNPLANLHSGVVISPVGASKKHGKVLSLIVFKTNLEANIPEQLFLAGGRQFKQKDDLAEMPTFDATGKEDGNALDYITKLITSDALKDITAQCAD